MMGSEKESWGTRVDRRLTQLEAGYDRLPVDLARPEAAQEPPEVWEDRIEDERRRFQARMQALPCAVALEIAEAQALDRGNKDGQHWAPDNSKTIEKAEVMAAWLLAQPEPDFMPGQYTMSVPAGPEDVDEEVTSTGGLAEAVTVTGLRFPGGPAAEETPTSRVPGDGLAASETSDPRLDELVALIVAEPQTAEQEEKYRERIGELKAEITGQLSSPPVFLDHFSDETLARLLLDLGGVFNKRGVRPPHIHESQRQIFDILAIGTIVEEINGLAGRAGPGDAQASIAMKALEIKRMVDGIADEFEEDLKSTPPSEPVKAGFFLPDLDELRNHGRTNLRELRKKCGQALAELDLLKTPEPPGTGDTEAVDPPTAVANRCADALDRAEPPTPRRVESVSESEPITRWANPAPGGVDDDPAF